MKTHIIISLILLASVSVDALAQSNVSTFNYNKWKAEQDEKNNTKKASDTEETETLLRPTYFYAEPFIMASKYRGPGIAIGGAYGNVNVEAEFVYGLVESYQIQRNIDNTLHGYTYHPYSYGVKAGYNFNYRGCLQLTPQVGIRQLGIHGDRANEVSEKASETATVQCLTLGLYLNYAFTRHLALAVTPEYSVAARKSELYDILVSSEGGDDIRRWAENFNVRIGLNIMF